MKHKQLPGPKTVAFIAACLLFAGAYRQRPLFSSNQNAYFLSGLARADYGYLSADWLANQTDHIPVFSAMVYLVQSLGSHWVFYLILSILAATYAGSLAIIASRPSRTRWSTAQTAVFIGLLTLLHSTWILSPLTEYIPDFWHIAPTFQMLASLATNGVAEQYILGPYLQPSAFGILIITSIACFVHEKEIPAILCALLAATIHPTYVLHAGVLTAAYMIVLVAEKRRHRAVAIGALAALMITPTILYVVLLLYPVSPLVMEKAQTVLMETRIPQHAKVSIWFSKHSCIQVTIILAGVMASYPCRRLFSVLVISLVASIGLTCLQVVSGDMGLALLFPWRLSTWLVPISTAILLGFLTVEVINLIDRFIPSLWLRRVKICIVCLCFAFIAASCFLGTRRTILAASSDPRDNVLSYAKSNSNRGQTYLVPLRYEGFRLASGLPIFVDWKSHPYRGDEFLEWHDRVQLARTFFDAENSEDAARALASIQKQAPITHIIVETGQDYLLNSLVHYHPIFRDSRHVLAELRELQ